MEHSPNALLVVKVLGKSSLLPRLRSEKLPMFRLNPSVIIMAPAVSGLKSRPQDYTVSLFAEKLDMDCAFFGITVPLFGLPKIMVEGHELRCGLV